MPDDPPDPNEGVMETDEDAAAEMEDMEDWEWEVHAAISSYLQEVSQGAINAVADRKEFQQQLQVWLVKQPEEVALTVFGRMRDIILEAAGRQGIQEARDLSADFQFTLSELSLSLAGQLINDVNVRIMKELRHLSAVQRIDFYDQVIEGLTQAETYALDALPPERTEFLKIARSLRAECHHACQNIRRHHRR